MHTTTAPVSSAPVRIDEVIRAEDSRAGEAETRECRIMVAAGILLIPAIWAGYYLIRFLQG